MPFCKCINCYKEAVLKTCDLFAISGSTGMNSVAPVHGSVTALPHQTLNPFNCHCMFSWSASKLNLVGFMKLTQK